MNFGLVMDRPELLLRLFQTSAMLGGIGGGNNIDGRYETVGVIVRGKSSGIETSHGYFISDAITQHLNPHSDSSNGFEELYLYCLSSQSCFLRS